MLKLAGSQPRDRRKIFTHTRAVKDVTLQDATLNAACVASVREDRARWFCTRREVELVKCGFSKDCEGCRVAASGDEVSRPHGKECRERIRVAVMCDDAGQQRLRTAEERIVPAASAARAEVAQEGQASPARVEAAQESEDEEMTEARVTNNADDVKPRIDESREDSTEVSDRMEDEPRIDESRDDSTEVTSRMEDGNTPVGGPLVSAELSSRSEGVPPSRNRGSEEGGLPENALLENADVSKMCINETTVIFKSLDVVSASEKVAELLKRNKFGDSAIDIGFERGIVADYATGWMNDNVGQQRLHATEQRVSSAGGQPSVATRVATAQEGPDEAMRQALAASSAKEASAASDADVVEKNQMGGEKLMLLIGSPMCCIIMIKSQNVVEIHARRTRRQGAIMTMMGNANRVSEVKHKNFVEQCVRHPEEKEMCQVLGNAGRLFLHGNLWDRWSRGLCIVKKMAENVGMRETKIELCRSRLTMCSPKERILHGVRH